MNKQEYLEGLRALKRRIDAMDDEQFAEYLKQSFRGKPVDSEQPPKLEKLMFDGVDFGKVGVPSALMQIARKIKWEDLGFPTDYDKRLTEEAKALTPNGIIIRIKKDATWKERKYLAKWSVCYEKKHRLEYMFLDYMRDKYASFPPGLLALGLAKLKFHALLLDYRERIEKDHLKRGIRLTSNPDPKSDVEYVKRMQHEFAKEKKESRLALGMLATDSQFSMDPETARIERIGMNAGCIRLPSGAEKTKNPAVRWVLLKKSDGDTGRKTLKASYYAWKDLVENAQLHMPPQTVLEHSLYHECPGGKALRRVNMRAIRAYRP